MIQSRPTTEVTDVSEALSAVESPTDTPQEEEQLSVPAPESPAQAHHHPPEHTPQQTVVPADEPITPTIAARPAEAEPRGEGTQKSRWYTWKEKIQGFIKKLFD